MLNNGHVNDAVGIQVWDASVHAMQSVIRPSENTERGLQSTPDRRCRSRRSDQDGTTYETASAHPQAHSLPEKLFHLLSYSAKLAVGFKCVFLDNGGHFLVFPSFAVQVANTDARS